MLTKANAPKLVRTVEARGIAAVVPGDATLRKYGMNADDYTKRLYEQNFICPICKRSPLRAADGMMHLVVDHFHARGYKKMSPEQKKKNVRGLVCITCNRYLVNRNVTIEKAENAIEYLRNFQARLDAEAGVAL